MLEAEVECRACKATKFVPWNLRHTGRDPAASGHAQVRCALCPMGKNFTDYTGRMRGEVVPKGNPPIRWA